MILLHKLDHYGIRGLPHKWFSDYLTNQTQYTIANGEKSKLAKTNCGVPQGSVLGPLLFLLYNNDIPSALQEGFKLRLFADDSNVFIADHDFFNLKHKLISALTSLTNWFNANKLTLNLAKTSYSIFSKRKIPEQLNSIKINSENIYVQSWCCKIPRTNSGWQAELGETCRRTMPKTDQNNKRIQNSKEIYPRRSKNEPLLCLHPF